MDKDAISSDNNKKLYCLNLFKKMCYGIGSDVLDMQEIYNEDGAISAVEIEYSSGFTKLVNVYGDSPMAMVLDIIKQGHLGSRRSIMKKITIIINGDSASVEEKGNLAQVDRLTGLALLAQRIRSEYRMSDKIIDKQINRAVSRSFAEQYVTGDD